ncbi:MAG: sulfotransferase [Rhizomicrobium sp.]|jgi:hypothetical protein
MDEVAGKSSTTLPRVILIGFNKCGTRTIHWYFKSNGYRSVHWDKGRLANRIFRNLVDSVPLLTGYEDYSVFSDMEDIVRGVFAFEAYKLYPYLSAQYPDSIFILNTRDFDKWLKSRFEHGAYAKKWKNLLAVDSDDQLVSKWRNDWERHHENVERFFAPGRYRFLKFDIENDNAEKLNLALPEYRLDVEKYSIRGRSTGQEEDDESD